MNDSATAQRELETPHPDHYAAHLAEVNEHNEVVSTEDIHNERGVLICRKGMRIDRDVAQRLVQHKLVRPLEEQVQLSTSVNPKGLFERLQQLLARDRDLNQVDDAHRFTGQCQELFTGRTLHPHLIQKLTVLQERLPHELDKGLFCAWLSALAGREMGLDRDSLYASFLAALVHDVGFLHIDPEIMRKEQPLSAAEWRAIQSHVVVGKLVLENIDDVDPRAARAVLEHHERCDGSGYPVGKNDEQLDILGQIVGAADSMHSIRMNRLAHQGRTFRDLKPYLQMNATTHFYEVYTAMCAVLDGSGLSPTRIGAPADIPRLARRLHARGTALHEGVRALTQPGTFDLAFEVKDRAKGLPVFKIANHVLVLTTQSGIVTNDLFEWLSGLIESPADDALGDLNDLEIMQDELYWQLTSARKVFTTFLESAAEDASRVYAGLQKVADAIDVSLKKFLDEDQR